MGSVVAVSLRAGHHFVISEGDVRPGDAIRVEMPATLHRPLQPV
jgi:MOSC domain-containing protein YiiM